MIMRIIIKMEWMWACVIKPFFRNNKASCKAKHMLQVSSLAPPLFSFLRLFFTVLHVLFPWFSRKILFSKNIYRKAEVMLLLTSSDLTKQRHIVWDRYEFTSRLIIISFLLCTLAIDYLNRQESFMHAK